MATLDFKQLSFQESDGKIRVTFQNLFYFDVDREILEKIGKFDASQHSIDFKDAPEKRARTRFNIILDKGLANLKAKLTNKKVIYIHQNSGIPLIGTNYFGIIDRGTNIVEIKPMNGCNLDCVFCSVDEGFSSRRQMDFFVEKDYLVAELKKLLDFKKCNEIHTHIAGQGETLMYPEIVELVRDIANVPHVKEVSIITNGTLLTRGLIDSLADAGLTRLNISLNAVDRKIADVLASRPYNVEKVMEMAEYASAKLTVILVPVILRGHNEKEISRIIEFCKDVQSKGGKIKLGIQNFLNYRFGRNPVKQFTWDEFYGIIDELDKKHDVNLRYMEDKLVETMEFPKPFKKGNIVTAQIVCSGRIVNEKLAVAKGRVISVANCFKDGKVDIRILRSKHNIFFGELK